jgi:hypothetical protein
MRERRIGLLDIGLDGAFNTSMMFVQSIVANINAGYDEPVAEVDFVRSRDPLTVVNAFTAPCDVLHVMAHGDASVVPAFVSSDGETEITLESLGEFCASEGFGISATAVIADGCRTGTGVWQKAVRDCLQGEVV